MKHSVFSVSRALVVCGFVFAASIALAAADAPVPSDPLPRFAAALETEPLVLIACRDARALNDKFGATTLAKMLTDPSYATGLQLIESQFTGLLGANAREL